MTAAAPAAAAALDMDRLVQCLDEETALQRELADFLARKERLLVAHDLAGLGALLAELDSPLARLEELARRRKRILGALGRRIGRPAEELRMSDVAEAAPPATRAKLAAAGDRLRAALDAVRALNRRTAALARQGAELNRGILHVLLRGTPPETTYGRRGAKLVADVPGAGAAREA